MTYNTFAYLVYGLIIIYITVYVGYRFHKNGEVFILELTTDSSIGIAINNLLLVLYYCLNIGSGILIISYWENLNNIPEMINSIGHHCGAIILLLGGLHYFNMFWIYLFFKFKKNNNFNYK